MLQIEELSLAFKTKQIINKYNFIFKKNYGQNFLVDQYVLDKIINSADINKNDIVLEIGPGIGTMTQILSKNAKKVIAVEIDKTLIPVLEDTLSEYSNIEIINKDILKLDIRNLVEKCGNKKIKIVANLPYYITTPIIMDILEKKLPVETITVMVQKEVAYRMKALPSTKDYGSLSLAVQYYCHPYIVANVPQNCFIPRPNVDSAVIKLSLFDSAPVSVNNEKLMFKIIKTAFSQRRKTLLNCLFNSNDFKFDKSEISDLLIKSGLNENIRGEKLNLNDFANLSNTIEKYI